MTRQLRSEVTPPSLSHVFELNDGKVLWSSVEAFRSRVRYTVRFGREKRWELVM